MLTRFKFLRNQQQKEKDFPNLCLSDFIAPKNSGTTDYLGGFVVTAGHGTTEMVKFYEDQLDDYNAIMAKVMADRLAEALAEYLHEKVRKEIWAYKSNEKVTPNEMLKEAYQGIRPAPGYPACPEHSEKKEHSLICLMLRKIPVFNSPKTSPCILLQRSVDSTLHIPIHNISMLEKSVKTKLLITASVKILHPKKLNACSMQISTTNKLSCKTLNRSQKSLPQLPKHFFFI